MKIRVNTDSSYIRMLNAVPCSDEFDIYINDNLVFERGEEVVWICRNCGHIYVGNKAPVVCPVCAHPQSFMELKAENY